MTVKKGELKKVNPTLEQERAAVEKKIQAQRALDLENYQKAINEAGEKYGFVLDTQFTFDNQAGMVGKVTVKPTR